MAGEVINKRAAQDRNGLGAHGGYQPDSVDTVSKRWFFRMGRKNGEYGINQNHPENETEKKEENGHPEIFVKFDKLAPHNVCCCNYSQISDSTAVIAHIREETAGKKNDASGGEQQQTDKEEDIQPEKRYRYGFKPHAMGGA